MSSTYSDSLRVELVGPGDQAGAWGTTTNNNFAFIFDKAIAGYLSVDITVAPYTLTEVNGPTSSSALNQSIYASLRFYNAVAASTVYAPAVSKTYVIWNDSSYAVTLYNTGYSTGPTIAAGATVLVFSTGTAFYEVSAQTVNGVVPITKGGTGQITANAAFNALAPVQTSANGRYLKSDGTNTGWDALDVGSADISGVLLGANGGTGVANTGKTITLGGNLTTSGAFATTLTATALTAVTLPTTGTLATLAGSETLTNKTINGSSNTITNVSLTSGVTGTLPVANGGTGVTTSTGSGSNVLSTSPSLTTPILGTPQSGNLSNCTFPTLNQNTTGTAGGLSGQPLITVNDINCYRPGSPSTGVIYLGNAGAYLYFDGSSYQMPSFDLTVGGNVTAYSDERVKTNWRDLPADFVEQLAKVKHGVYDRTDQDITQVGVSAQSLQPVMEHAVIADNEGKLSVAYGNAALVAAIKLAERVVALEAKLEALTGG